MVDHAAQAVPADSSDHRFDFRQFGHSLIPLMISGTQAGPGNSNSCVKNPGGDQNRNARARLTATVFIVSQASQIRRTSRHRSEHAITAERRLRLRIERNRQDRSPIRLCNVRYPISLEFPVKPGELVRYGNQGIFLTLSDETTMLDKGIYCRM
jgi:hypothetical protein